MANMSYCRFENTYRDLQDCVNAMEQGCINDLSGRELVYAKKMMQLCEEYLNYQEEVELEAEDRKNMEDAE